jgi:hypothetical protein
MHPGQDKKRTPTEKVMRRIAVKSVVLFAMVAYPARNPLGGSLPNAPVSAPAAATPPALEPPKTAEVRPVVTARTPAAAVRQITHLNAEGLSDAEGSAQRRLVGKVALQVERAVRWSPASDPELAGKADGAAALEAFYQAAKPLTAATASGKGKAARAGVAEPPDQLKTQVQHLVTADAADSFENRLGPEKCQAYLKAFQIAFNRDERARAGD